MEHGGVHKPNFIVFMDLSVHSALKIQLVVLESEFTTICFCSRVKFEFGCAPFCPSSQPVFISLTALPGSLGGSSPTTPSRRK